MTIVPERLRRDTLWRQVAWVIQRAAGVGLLLFLILHIGDTSLVVLDPSAYNSVVDLYKQPVFDVVEIVLIGPLIFHAFNGLRIVVQDFWLGWLPYQRQLLSGTYAATLALWGVFAYFMVVK
jgi:succinate dehydrogenase / fumarate reductase cytochrome b subunit